MKTQFSASIQPQPQKSRTKRDNGSPCFDLVLAVCLPKNSLVIEKLINSMKVGTPDGPITLRAISNAQSPDLAHSTFSLPGNVLSGSRSQSLGYQYTHPPGYDTISSGNSMQQLYHTPVSACDTGYDITNDMGSLTGDSSSYTLTTHAQTPYAPNLYAQTPEASPFDKHFGPATCNHASKKTNTKAPQRRRKYQRKPGPKNKMRWACTGCNRIFDEKSHWKRHELLIHASHIHFPENEWKCQPNIILTENKTLYCLTCHKENLSSYHVLKHGAKACA